MSKLTHRLAVLFVVFSLLLGQAQPVSAQDNTPEPPTPTPAEVTPTPGVPTETPALTETPLPATITSIPSSTPYTPSVASHRPDDLSGGQALTPSLTPTETPTPETATPDYATTQLPDHPTNAYMLEIITHPGFLTKSRNINLEWTITGMTEGQTGLTLAITLPAGYEPKDTKKSGETYNAATGIYTVPVKGAQGQVQIRALKVKTDIVISASLFNGAESLAGDALILPVHQQFDMNADGGEINALDGKVKVTFPAGALAENAEVNFGFPTDDALPPGFSDKVFELKAHAKNNDISTGLDNPREISHFNAPLTIEVDYSDMVLDKKQESELYLYWYNQQTGEWYALETTRDMDAKVLRAETDHFTVFDVGVNDWQAERLPSVEAWQTSQFTGAATYSVPITVPEGAGGFKPNVTLSYNSQVVDQATTETQAAWVGMGWSLDGGGSIRDNEDGTYSLTVNGISTLLVTGDWSTNPADKSGTFTSYAADENFWKITHTDNFYGNTLSWLVYDTQGNQYSFTQRADAPYYEEQNNTVRAAAHSWYLTTATNPSGQSIAYHYYMPTKIAAGLTTHTAAYIETITYNGYRVRFAREARNDYWTADLGGASFNLLQTERLKTVYVEHLDGTLIRRYEFTYTGASQIWPGIVYTAGGKALALQALQEYGADGSALPAQTFLYGDSLHLTSASNGYGGSVAFTYNVWNSATAPKTGIANLKSCSGGEESMPILGWTRLTGSAGCYLNYMGVGNKSSVATGYGLDKMVTPGKRYGVSFAGVKPYSYTTCGNLYYNIGLLNGGVEQLGAKNAANTVITLSASARARFQLYFKNTGCLVEFIGGSVYAYPTFYRVAAKTVNAGDGNSYASTYAYSGPVVGTYDFEFRGHAQVTETAPDGTKTTTSFYQDDSKKGRAYQVEVKSPNGATVSKTESAYNKVVYKDTVMFDWVWVYLDAQVNHIYNTGGAEVGATRTEYDYDEELRPGTGVHSAGNYGNLTQKREYDGASLYRKTVIAYSPNANTYVVGSPWHETVSDSANQIIADTKYYYDANHAPMPTDGLLTRTEKLIGAGQYAQTDYAYDGYGNQTVVTVHNVFNNVDVPQTSTTVYDTTYHTFPISTTNAAGHTVSFEYDYDQGLPISMTDANGQTVTAAYDSFGRITSVTRTQPETSTLTMIYSNGYPFTTTVTLNPIGYSVTRVYDGMGRETSSTSGGVTTTTTYVNPTVTTKTMPGSSAVTTTTVDLNARTTTVTAPDGTSTVSATNGLTSTVTDAKGNATTTVSDIQGHVLTVTPPTGPAVNYAYNSLDQLTQVTRGGATTSMTYDLAGRKLTMSDADMGNWSYAYDTLGNLKTQTDARGCVLTMNYDVLNRLTDKSSAGSCGTQVNTSYRYDEGTYGIGRRTSMSLRQAQGDASGDTSSSWTYDIRGRVESETVMGYTTHYDYNPADLMTSMTYPDGEVVNYGYNSRMLLNSVIGTNPYVASTGYDDAGRITARGLSNGLTQKYVYNAWNVQGGRLAKMVTGSGAWTEDTFSFANNVQKLNYGYDAVGNIANITNPVANENQSYAYDALDRLTNWTATNTGVTPNVTTYQEAYDYDAAGNLDHKAGVDLNYNDANHKHAATGAGVNTYSYDANGNQITRHVGNDTFNLAYDAENRLVEVKKNNVTQMKFTYDGDGKRVKSESYNSAGTTITETILFVGNHYEVKNPGSGETISKYYFAGTSRIAMRKYTIPQRMRVEYVLGDHLGSTSLTTDANGAKVSEIRYKPFGETRYTWTDQTLTATPSYVLTKYQFTGQFSYETEFGLLYYGARMYDPALGRFSSPDTIIPEQSQGTQAWDRFAYANNAPIKYVDPTGHWIETAFDVAMVVVDVADIASNGLNWGNGAALALDVASVILPGIPAVGGALLKASKVVNTVDNVIDAANAVDNVADGAKTIENIVGAVCSFDADTTVTTDNGEKAISTIQIGDAVLAWNEADGTLGFYEVTAVMAHDDEVLTELIIDGEWIETTPEHPFYTEEEGWLPADELKMGMHIVKADRTAGVVWLKWNVHRTQAMYNLTVDTAHTYFVGKGQWLVHNECPGKVVIGETMDRVKDAAKETGAKWYQAWKIEPFDFDLAMKRNEAWIRGKIQQGYEIIDIGTDSKRATRSPFYEMEKSIIEELDYPVTIYAY